MKHIPNLFTLLNLVAGILAMIFALQTEAIFITQDDQLVSSFNIPERLSWAGIAIFVAALIDFADGFIARLLKATSELGKQLDSLSDVVSFGVAPSVILYQLLRLSYAREEGGIYVSMVVLLPALLFACAAAYRLGRFNLSSDQQQIFHGLPTPAAGMLIASLPLILHFSSHQGINGLIVNKWVLYAAIVLLSYLMVSHHRMMSLKFSSFALKKDWPVAALLAIGILSAIVSGWLAVPVVFILYILLSFLTTKKVIP